jgi:hypothetical protein
MSAPRTAVQKRAQHAALAQWAPTALTQTGPLRFPADPALPPSPKRRYRSAYQPPAPGGLASARLADLSAFEIALQLIDFSPLERELAQHYQRSAKGQVPFHPVSLFLAICLGRERGLSWRALAQLLQGEHGAGWRRRFGFVDGDTPAASTLRAFVQQVGADFFAELCPRFIDLLRSAGRLPERSTFPGDPPGRGVSVCQDGMLHPARHQQTCRLATDSCFRPLAVTGDAPPSRPCRARERNLPGCACADACCQAQCRRGSRQDPEARFIHYEGRMPRAQAGTPDAARPAGRGTDVFGYRSLAERLLDDRLAIAWTLTSDLYPANTDERTVFVRRLQALRVRFPDLAIGEWLDDAGVGFSECLDAVWELGALRMVDIRADPSDRDAAACRQRGYDGQGRPLCPHGYRLRANGTDGGRRRTKYICAQACRREPLEPGGPVQEVTGCPYLTAGSCGQVVNVGRTLPDGSTRLARDIPYGSPAWTARYGRRNLAESRNGQVEGMGLKRMRAYGLPRSRREVQLADFLINLRTLGRLVREAMSQPMA